MSKSTLKMRLLRTIKPKTADTGRFFLNFLMVPNFWMSLWMALHGTLKIYANTAPVRNGEMTAQKRETASVKTLNSAESLNTSIAPMISIK